ncbi:hypothetical protein [Sulfurimonas sp. HSL3-7]|uniref:hypothetical protein n=1 Tax=Sulfonitrofixus jiaomeiensis TaxID=3131938 RepID=UPI0031F87E0F
MDELQKKKNELKYWIDRIGYDQVKFAKMFFVFHNEIDADNEDEIRKFVSRFKKDITRGKKIEVIETYLKFLFEMPEFEKHGFVKPSFYYEDEFNENFNRRMKNISKNITERIISQERDNDSV